MPNFKADVQDLHSKMIEWRRDFHRHPEIAFEETRTATIVAEELDALGMEVQRGVGKTGVIGILEGAKDGPTVLVRADMDALPIQEANETAYVSGTPQRMHACGHDAHTAIALTVANIYAKHRDQIAGRIKFLFQPAEEIGAGAKAMINDGALQSPAPDVALGLHVWNSLPVGKVSVTSGPAMAGVRSFTIQLKGKGGHAAVPNETHDPVIAMAQIINAAQTIISRNIDPIESGVVSFTEVHGGDAFNVIPDDVRIRGTIRTYKPEILERIVQRFETIVHGIAQTMDCVAEIEYRNKLQPLINDPTIAMRLYDVFRNVDESLDIVDDVRTMGSEDMGEFLARVPGVFFFVGSANAEQGLNFPHHHPRFDIDEESLSIGATLLASAVAEYVWQS